MEGAGIQIVMKYIGNIYIVPKGIQPEVTIESVRVDKTGDVSPKLNLTFRNQGTSHTILRDLTLDMTQENDAGETVTIRLKPEDLRGVAGENILAGHRRLFQIPLPPGLQDGDIEVSFSFQPTR